MKKMITVLFLGCTLIFAQHRGGGGMHSNHGGGFHSVAPPVHIAPNSSYIHGNIGPYHYGYGYPGLFYGPWFNPYWYNGAWIYYNYPSNTTQEKICNIEKLKNEAGKKIQVLACKQPDGTMKVYYPDGTVK